MILLKLLRFWLPVVLCAGFIFWASSLHGSDAPALFPYMDKVIHITEYGILGWLLVRAFTHASAAKRAGTIHIIVFIVVCLYGISDEYHQSFVPGRYADLLDVLADMFGGTLGGWIYKFSKS